MIKDVPLRLHGIWPTDDEELAIRAALADGERAIAAWKEWLDTNDLDRLSFGSFRLLPLIYSKLAAAHYDGPEMSKLRGVYRQSWYRNQLLLHTVEAILMEFSAAHVPTLLMKGIPLSLRTYQDAGVRSMGDGDILVPPGRRDDAIRILEARGWRRFSAFLPGHAVVYESSDGLQIDLHWYLTKYHRVEAASEPFWKGAVPFQLGEASTLAMNHTDELLHCLIHGMHWEQDLPIRWIPDALNILARHPADIDWDRFVAVAVAVRNSPTIRTALDYLISRYQADVPPGLLERLEQESTAGERLENWFRLHATARHPWGMLPLRWIAYWRSERQRGAIPTPVGFLRELKKNWGIRSWVEMPGQFLRLLGRRLRWLAVSWYAGRTKDSRGRHG